MRGDPLITGTVGIQMPRDLAEVAIAADILAFGQGRPESRFQERAGSLE